MARIFSTIVTALVAGAIGFGLGVYAAPSDGVASLRAAIDKLIAEQNFSNSDRADPVTAAKIGRILGVDAIILGTITHYDYEDKVTGGGGTSFGGFGRL